MIQNKITIIIRSLSIIILPGIVLGCTLLSPTQQNSERHPQTISIDTFYLTDRNMLESDRKTVYGHKRGEVTYGISRVGIRTDKSRSPFANIHFGELI